MGKTLICPHSGSDFDTFGAAVGASLLFDDPFVYLPQKIEESLSGFISEFFPELMETRGRIPEDVDTLVVVDTHHIDKIECSDDYERVVVIDHHPGPVSIRATETVIRDVGATSTIVALELRERKIEVEPRIATALLAGIYEDTGYLSFAGVTPDDFEAAAFLVRNGADIGIVTRFVRNSLTPPQLEILQEMISEGEILVVNGRHIGIVVLKLDSYIHDISLIMNHYMNALELDAAFVILDFGNRAMVIGRSRTPDFEVLPVIKKLGGGGHKLAASAVMEKIVIVEVIKKLKNTLLDLEDRRYRAEDVMFAPLITIGEGRRIADAAEVFSHYSFNVLPVINRNGKFAGLITRQIVDKLLYHNLEKAKIKDFMLTEIRSVGPDTPLSEVKRIMVENNQRFVPVVDERGHPIGGITRKELMKVLWDEVEDSGVIPATGKRRNIAEAMKNFFPEKVLSVIREIGEIADSLGMRAYIVGGSVRDIILGRKNFDVDIVVEGDAIKLAEKVASREGYEFSKWPRYGTATVYMGDLHFDFSSARLEYYPRGRVSYPVVRRGSLYQDLYRRDFTINAMAISISPDCFGELFDPFRGYYDLKKRVIRIIHQLSFIEDPARILRAARFAGKLNFSIGKATQKALKSALQMDIFRRFPTRRLFHEFNRIMEEESAPEIFLIMEKFAILDRIVRGVRVKDRLYRELLEGKEGMSWFRMLYPDEELSVSIVNWIIFKRVIGEKKFQEAVEVLMIPREFMKHLKSFEKRLTKTLEVVNKHNDLASIVGKLDAIPPEVIVLTFVEVKNEDKRKLLSSYLSRWREVKPFLTGDDLIKLGFKPGPVFSEIMDTLKVARVRGEVGSREDEIKYVVQKFSHLIEKERD